MQFCLTASETRLKRIADLSLRDFLFLLFDIRINRDHHLRSGVMGSELTRAIRDARCSSPLYMPVLPLEELHYNLIEFRAKLLHATFRQHN